MVPLTMIIAMRCPIVTIKRVGISMLFVLIVSWKALGQRTGQRELTKGWGDRFEEEVLKLLERKRR